MNMYARIGLVLLVGVALVLLVFMRGSGIEETSVDQTPDVSILEDRVLFGGQPTAADLAEFSREGVTTVVNLRAPAEMESVDFDEQKIVEDAGMTYLNVPVGRDELSGETIETLFDVLAGSDRNKVLLHCASSNRVGYIWAMYRGVHDGVALERALEEGKRAGLRSEALVQRARDYIAANGG